MTIASQRLKIHQIEHHNTSFYLFSLDSVLKWQHVAWRVSLHGVGASTEVMVPIWTLEYWSLKHLFTPLLISDPFLLTVQIAQVLDRSCSPTKETTAKNNSRIIQLDFFIHDPFYTLNQNCLLNQITCSPLCQVPQPADLATHLTNFFSLWNRNASPPDYQEIFQGSS